LINTFDRLKTKSLPRKPRIDLGEPEVTSKAKTAIDSLQAMGVSPDIASALVADLLTSNPDSDLMNMLEQASNTVAQSEPVSRNENTKRESVYMKPEDWSQLSEPDLRKLYSEKSGTMYEILKEKGMIYPIDELLKK
jgi:hypothetical protein